MMKYTDNYDRIHFIVRVIKPILLFVLIGAIYFFVLIRFNIGIPCVFRKLTGYQCPGCGMTHAMIELFRFNIKGAWDYNALSITVFPVLCIYLLFRWIRENGDNDYDFRIWEYIFLVVLFAVVLIYGIFRNLY